MSDTGISEVLYGWRCVMQVAGFPYDNSSIVKYAYAMNNYKLIYTGSKTGRAIVFFSGNGLYYPNTEENFNRIIIKNDRYEWENIACSKRIQRYYDVVIFVRDVYKQWYINGINSSYDSVEKVIDLLKHLTHGFRVTTCGSSAGGYMATLIGAEINAERVFALSAQFDIADEKNGPLIKLGLEGGKTKWMNISKLVSKYKSVFYLFPQKSKNDVEQYNMVKERVRYSFAINESMHSLNIHGIYYTYLLTRDNEDLIRINKKFGLAVIEKDELFRAMIPACSFRCIKFYLELKQIAFKIKCKICFEKSNIL